MRGGDDIQIASGGDDKRLTGVNAAADVVEVIACLCKHDVTGDAAAEVVDVLCIQADDLASGDGAATVVEIATEIHLDAAAGHQCAVTNQVAILYAHIKLRIENFGGAAVSQNNVGFD